MPFPITVRERVNRPSLTRRVTCFLIRREQHERAEQERDEAQRADQVDIPHALRRNGILRLVPFVEDRDSLADARQGVSLLWQQCEFIRLAVLGFVFHCRGIGIDGIAVLGGFVDSDDGPFRLDAVAQQGHTLRSATKGSRDHPQTDGDEDQTSDQ